MTTKDNSVHCYDLLQPWEKNKMITYKGIWGIIVCTGDLRLISKKIDLLDQLVKRVVHCILAGLGLRGVYICLVLAIAVHGYQREVAQIETATSSSALSPLQL